MRREIETFSVYVWNVRSSCLVVGAVEKAAKQLKKPSLSNNHNQRAQRRNKRNKTGCMQQTKMQSEKKVLRVLTSTAR